jgi:phenylacetate-CoA ligase
MLLGEVSSRPARTRLGASWDGMALDASYGSTETGTIGAACEHDRMHLLLAGHILEVRNDQGIQPALPGVTGELVTTTLNNFARPLIRYATGDVVSIEDGAACPCDIPLPTVAVHGRSAESIRVGNMTVSVLDLESVLYRIDGITGYLVQLRRPQGSAARLILERDVDFAGDPKMLCARASEAYAEVGIRWDQVISVGQLSVLAKAGGSQKNWKRTNVEWTD